MVILLKVSEDEQESSVLVLVPPSAHLGVTLAGDRYSAFKVKVDQKV